MFLATKMSPLNGMIKFVILVIPLYCASKICFINAETKEGIDFVTDFNSNPKESTFKENYLNLPVTNGDSIQSFTFCFRVKLHTIIKQCIFDNSEFGFNFQNDVYGFLLLHKAWIMFQFKEPLLPLKWYHVCTSYNAGHIVIIMNDHVLKDEHNSDLKGLDDPRLVLKSTLSIGICEGKNDPLKAVLRGTITDFDMWSIPYAKDELLSFTTKCKSFSENGDIMTWNMVGTSARGENAKLIQIQKEEACDIQTTPGADKSIVALPIKLPYDSAKQFCLNLGGTFPLPTSSEQIGTWMNLISDENKEDSEGNDIIKDTCSNTFWMPIRQNGKSEETGEYIWSEDITSEKKPASFLPWEFSQPNGLEIQQCVTLTTTNKQLGDGRCLDSFCSLCQFSGSVEFHIHGLPDTSPIDHNYLFLPKLQTGSGLNFAGFRQYQIDWLYSRKAWNISDRSDPQNPVAIFNISQSNFPIGKQNWFLRPDVTQLPDGRNITPLKLSKCDTKDEFTCDDGTCLNMTGRCDGIFQCLDKSDEDQCKLININKAIYNKDYPPRKEASPLDVKVTVIIVAIQQVKELHMTFSSKLTLQLEWSDERVTFSNLKPEDLTNVIGYDRFVDVWVPPVIFNNTNQNVMVVHNEYASMFVNKRGTEEVAPLSSVNENYNFQGSENILLYSIDYEMTYNCVFNLESYPFDTQTCQIEMKVPVSMDAFMQLTPGGVIYQGPKTMVQFVVQSTKMYLKDPKYIVVEITLKRMFRYHLAATYVPTTLLMIVTEITLFVDEKHFEATIMVHLTTMLVMYTLYQGVSASMPKTADLKFIDIWLLFGLVVPFVTFVVETILRLLSTDIEDEEKVEEEKRGYGGYGKLINVKIQNKTIPLEMNRTIDFNSSKKKSKLSFRMKIKVLLQYSSQILIPLTTILFVISYLIQAYIYYNN